MIIRIGLVLILCVSAMLLALPLRAELTIEISQGVQNPTRIAVIPFEWTGVGVLPENIADIVSADLLRSGQFVALEQKNMLSMPHERNQVFFRDWRVLEQEYLLIGRIEPAAGGFAYKVSYELYDIYKQQRILGEVISGDDGKLRDVAHLISDNIYKVLTGIDGVFSTRIAYVTANRSPQGVDQYRLQVSDADGYRAQTVLESNEPLLSPDWSPDNRRLAYVSFEGRRPGIYIQDLKTGQREKLPWFRGLNSAPAWSPDGRQLAVVLSKDGNPEIYIYTLATKAFRRLTQHFGIDTEPSWAPDGQSLVFTSSRGGGPQIYRANVATGAVQRITFEGDYNARGRLSQDGRFLVMVHRRDGVFHIAVQDLARGGMRVLTETNLDESPSIAPNGSMLIYATTYQSRGVLAVVSVDGRVKFRLPSKYGDVREPVWSSY